MMAEFPWGALASVGGNIIGGILGNQAADRARDQQADFFQRNLNWQREVAMHGIKMRVDDAKRSGIHPLAALGSPLISPSPVSVSGGQDNSWGNAFQNMGQDVSRALMSTRTQNERDEAYIRGMRELQAEGLVLDNEFKRSQIARMNSGQVGPPFPGSANVIPGQAQAAAIPSSRNILDVVRGSFATREVPQQERENIPEVGHAVTRTGYAPVPGKEMKERIEDSLLLELPYIIRNHILPSFGINQTPPTKKAPPGFYWTFNPWKQEYQLKQFQTWQSRGTTVPIPPEFRR